MKLLNKLTLYHTLSKTALVLLFTTLLPLLVKEVASRYTNTALQDQKQKVLQTIDKNGIEYYFQGDSSYRSYTMLRKSIFRWMQHRLVFLQIPWRRPNVLLIKTH
ncbi:MAG: hypothetical protein H0X41_08195 [Chitinophagaceae bacterium]|nr:hypothetical protein [Chitinophagaceae bacterium]